jgi:voltage-gated potassium channel
VTTWSLTVIVLLLFFPLPSAVRQVLQIVDYGICFVFLIDFLRSLRRAPNKLRYFLRWGWLDLLGSFPSLPILRLLRIGRILISVRQLHDVPLHVLLRQIREQRAQSTLLVMLFLLIFIITVSASVVAVAEGQAPNANIADGEDAFWWAFVTITTVGYGDFVPVTQIGRLFATLLMLVGVGLFTVLTSYIASTFLKPSQKKDTDNIEALKRELAEIKEILKKQQERS